MSYVVAIPTYKRAEVLNKKSLPLLLNHNVKADRIYLFVADASEKADYEKVIDPSHYNKIVIGKKGISYQRNFIIDYFKEGEHIVFIDDDITQVVRKRGSNISQIDDMDEFFRNSFKQIKDEKLYLWTTKNQYNPFYKKQMKDEGEIGLVLFSGDLMGIINRKSMKIKTTLEKGEAEQWELLFMYQKRDGGILRYNNVVVISQKLSPGGKTAERGSVKARKADIIPNIQALVKAYPEYVKGVKGTDKYTGREKLEVINMATKKVKGASLHSLLSGCGLERLIGGITAQPIVKNIVSEEDKTSTTRKQLPIRNKVRYNAAKDKLLEELHKITVSKIPKPATGPNTNRGNVIGTIGRTMTFGFGDNRQGWNFYATNKKYPELFKALVAFGNSVVPKGWRYQGITLNHGVKAKKHKDKKNVGESVIIGIGDYTGGTLRVWDGDDKNPKDFDIRNKPTMFNGGNLFHETQPFEGDRYTIIFYKQGQRPKTGEVGIGKGHTTSEPLPQPDYPEVGAIFG